MFTDQTGDGTAGRTETVGDVKEAFHMLCKGRIEKVEDVEAENEDSIDSDTDGGGAEKIFFEDLLGVRVAEHLGFLLPLVSGGCVPCLINHTYKNSLTWEAFRKILALV